MAHSTFKLPTPRNELAISVLLGVAFAMALFVLMALAQMLGEVEVPAAPELALTGPNDLLWTLTFGGLAMVLLGSVLVAREQRIRA